MAVSENIFREAMGRFASGVTVVTSPPGAGRAPVGVTISSLTSVSLRPPLVLWCLDRSADTFPVFREAPAFAVSILCAEQEALSIRFSAPGNHALDGVSLETGATGAPLIAGALVQIECRKTAEYDGGDHAIFVGEVIRARTRAGEPLVYFRGAYSGLGRE